MRPSPAGSDGFRSVTALGVSFRMAEITDTGVSPRNGCSPVAIWCSITPSEKMSDRESTGFPSACSGDMYATVPTMRPWPVRPVAARVVSPPDAAASISRSLARPKSSTFTCPDSVTITLAGLRSRWVMPRCCAAAIASAIAAPTVRIRSSGRPSAGMRSASVRPSTSSIVRNSRPSASSTEWIVTMFGWFSAAAARASRSKRSRLSGSLATRSGSTLSATRRWSFVSSASYTSPMPPRPISRRIW